VGLVNKTTALQIEVAGAAIDPSRYLATRPYLEARPAFGISGSVDSPVHMDGSDSRCADEGRAGRYSRSTDAAARGRRVRGVLEFVADVDAIARDDVGPVPAGVSNADAINMNADIQRATDARDAEAAEISLPFTGGAAR
jgi:hypothetical protein